MWKGERGLSSEIKAADVLVGEVQRPSWYFSTGYVGLAKFSFRRFRGGIFFLVSDCWFIPCVATNKVWSDIDTI